MREAGQARSLSSILIGPTMPGTWATLRFLRFFNIPNRVCFKLRTTAPIAVTQHASATTTAPRTRNSAWGMRPLSWTQRCPCHLASGAALDWQLLRLFCLFSGFISRSWNDIAHGPRSRVLVGADHAWMRRWRTSTKLALLKPRNCENQRIFGLCKIVCNATTPRRKHRAPWVSGFGFAPTAPDDRETCKGC